MSSSSLEDALLVDHVEHRAVVAVRDHAALRRPRRARRVDEGADVVGGDRAPALLPLGRPSGPRRARSARPSRSRRRRALHPDHVLELRAAVPDRAIFSSCSSSSTITAFGVGVLEHVLALLGRVGLVDRDHGRAGAERREVEVGPLGPGVGEDRDLVALLDAEVDQPEGERLGRSRRPRDRSSRPTGPSRPCR